MTSWFRGEGYDDVDLPDDWADDTAVNISGHMDGEGFWQFLPPEARPDYDVGFQEKIMKVIQVRKCFDGLHYMVQYEIDGKRFWRCRYGKPVV
jgi:hypothetical protein